MKKTDDIKVVDIPLEKRLSSAIRPQDDYFGYVNDKWLKANPIPDTEARWGSFYVLREKSWLALRTLCQNLESTPNMKPGSLEQKIRDFYKCGMEFDIHADENAAALVALMEKIDSIKNNQDISGLIGWLHRSGVSGPWNIELDADDKNSSRHMLRFRQSGLSLPEKHYYLGDDQKIVEARTAFEAYVKRSVKLIPKLGSNPEAVWKTIWDIELDLAQVSRSSVELRDIELNYNPTQYETLVKTYSSVNWNDYAAEARWTPDDKITVDQPEFLKHVDLQIAALPTENWKTYLKWRVFNRFSRYVSQELAQNHFDFYGRVLNGTKTMPPLWKRVLIAMELSMGEVVGQLYVKENFPETSKNQVLDIVEDVRGAYAKRIKKLSWMSDKTKDYALKKLANIKVLIGYPDKWRDFSKLVITPESYMANIISCESFQSDYEMARLHEPISRDDWFMSPQTVNAYHDPNRLVICFPAAILQPPFFDPTAHVAQNFGGIGSVVGHELTHGFDDQGCQFDAEGNVRTWQTKSEQSKFHKLSKVVSDQADKFEVLPGLFLKGGLVLGESIADLGGIEIALEALKDNLANTRDKRPGNFSVEDLFFITYAECECGETRDNAKREQTISDEHPDSVFRVNGMLQHCDDFHRIYKTKPSDKLYRDPENRARIW